MNLSNFTIKAAEVIQGAQQIAYNSQHSNIETEHLLKALLEQEESPVEYLLKKNAVNIQTRLPTPGVNDQLRQPEFFYLECLQSLFVSNVSKALHQTVDQNHSLPDNQLSNLKTVVGYHFVQPVFLNSPVVFE